MLISSYENTNHGSAFFADVKTQFTNLRAVLIFVSLISGSCTHLRKDNVSVTISENYLGEGEYTITHRPLFDDVILKEGKLDSSRVIEFKLISPLTVKLVLDSVEHKVYLEPGYALTIDPTSAMLFSEKGGAINNLLSKISQAIDLHVDRGLMDADPNAFLIKCDSLKEQLDQFSSFSGEGITLSDQVMLGKFIGFRMASLRLEYAFHLHNSALIEQIYASQKKEGINTFSFPVGLRDAVESIPFDTVLFRAEMDGYHNMLFNYLLEGVHNSTFDITRWDNPSPTNSQRLLLDASIASPIKEYLMATNLNHWARSQGITSGVDTLYKSFIQLYPQSRYREFLQNVYEQQLTILPGSVAPDIKGTTIDGRKFSMRSLNDKMVYVDVWATWCSPCVQEIPFSKSLQQEMSTREDIVFLNVSVDKDADAWKRMLSKQSHWGGIHIILNEEQTDSLESNYRVNGYPKYFIIHRGRIVTAKAPRPSETELKKILSDSR